MSNWKDDCKITVVNPNKGGQQVGFTNTPVRVVHEPTGITAECGEARSQFKNKNVAMSMIQWALIELGFNSEYVK
jgi:protein subunit release factor A